MWWAISSLNLLLVMGAGLNHATFLLLLLLLLPLLLPLLLLLLLLLLMMMMMMMKCEIYRALGWVVAFQVLLLLLVVVMSDIAGLLLLLLRVQWLGPAIARRRTVLSSTRVLLCCKV
jgi:hypothetical protein